MLELDTDYEFAFIHLFILVFFFFSLPPLSSRCHYVIIDDLELIVETRLASTELPASASQVLEGRPHVPGFILLCCINSHLAFHDRGNYIWVSQIW